VLAKFMGHRRNDMILATKFGYDFYDKSVPRIGHQERPQKFEKEFIKFACEQSLRRLDTDHIDLYQLHNPKAEALDRDEVFETLEQLQSEGKIRYFGAALGPDIGWYEEGEISMRQRHLDSVQIIYSILEQEPALDFFPIAEEENIGLLSRVPHASNMLTGAKLEIPKFDENDHRALRKAEWMRESMLKVERVQFLVDEGERTMGQTAIQFVLAKPAIISVLPNITSMDDLKEFTQAVHTPPLTQHDLDHILELWHNGFDLKEPEKEFREI
jgi:aryl-alcohol dehydrogenase-like predicted oxidoreductase